MRILVDKPNRLGIITSVKGDGNERKEDMNNAQRIAEIRVEMDKVLEAAVRNKLPLLGLLESQWWLDRASLIEALGG